jgi:UDP-N-acetyl-D-mannosaminuronic acid dehydrogenase
MKRTATPKPPAFKRVSVLGLGYVGLPMAAIMATRGIEVIGVDVNRSVVERINAGGIHIVEPGLDIVVRGAVAAGNLRAAATPEPAEAFIIAVPTPFKDGYVPDMRYCEEAARAIAPVLKTGDLVVLESTSPVGTTEDISRWMAEIRPDLKFPHQHGTAADISIAHSPERILPGRVLIELVANSRIIGGITPRCAERAAALYRMFVEGELHLTNARTAELAKLSENSFRDVNIAFANELSMVCEKVGVDVWELIRLANCHPRVNILQPGPGVGGHCIAVDPWFIVHAAPAEAKLIRASREINEHKAEHVVERVRHAAARFRAPVIACLGLSYKADIDDLRESPAIHIVKALAQSGFDILAVEPNVHTLPADLAAFANVQHADLDDAIERADIVVLLVDHKEFKLVPKSELLARIVVDTRGVWAGTL